MTPVIKFVELPNQVSLPYVEQGDASGVPVVLLHGLADSWRSFELVLPHLPETIRALALTQRGHGDASRPDSGYRIQDFADDAAAFLDALHLKAAVFAGHSSHSLVVERLALDHADRILGLVLIGGPATLRDKPSVRELLESVSRLTDPVDEDFVREFAHGTFVRVPQEFFEAMVQENLKVPARVWKEAFAGLVEEDLSSELHRITAPTLLVWGDRDTIVSRGDQETVRSAIPGSQLVVYPGTGHSPHWEEPARFAADLVSFLESLARYAAPTARRTSTRSRRS